MLDVASLVKVIPVAGTTEFEFSCVDDEGRLWIVRPLQEDSSKQLMGITVWNGISGFTAIMEPQ